MQRARLTPIKTNTDNGPPPAKTGPVLRAAPGLLGSSGSGGSGSSWDASGSANSSAADVNALRSPSRLGAAHTASRHSYSASSLKSPTLNAKLQALFTLRQAQAAAAARAEGVANPSPALETPWAARSPLTIPSMNVRRGIGDAAGTPKALSAQGSASGKFLPRMVTGIRVSPEQHEQLTLWRTKIAEDLSTCRFSSPILEQELILTRAVAWRHTHSHATGPETAPSLSHVPSQLAVAVALETLNKLADNESVLRGSLNTVRSVLASALFSDCAAVPEDDATEEEVAAAWYQDQPLEVYFASTLYRKDCRALFKDKLTLQAASHELELQLERTKDEVKTAMQIGEQSSVATINQLRDDRTKLLAAVERANERNEELQDLLAKPSQHLASLFQQVHDKGMKRTVLLALLDTVPDMWSQIALDLLNVLPIDQLKATLIQAIREQDGVTIGDIEHIMAGMMTVPTVRDSAGAKAYLLKNMIAGAGRHVQTCLESCLEQLKPEQNLALIRHLSGFSSTLDLEMEEQPATQYEPDTLGVFKTGVVNTGKSLSMSRPGPPVTTAQITDALKAGNLSVGTVRQCFGALSLEEMRQVTQISLKTLPQAELDRMLPTFLTATPSNVNTLLKQLDETAVKQLTADMLQGLSPDERCGLLNCPFHDHNRPLVEPTPIEGDAKESDAAAAEAAAAKERLERQKQIEKKRRSPLARYLTPPTDASNLPSMKLPSVVGLIYDCLEKKLLADEIDDREGSPRSSMPEFVRDFLLQKYGLPSICDGYLYSIVQLIIANKNVPRVGLFGVMTGVVHPNQYDPQVTGVVLNMIKLTCPKFSSTMLRARRPGSWVASAATVVSAVNTVLVDGWLAFPSDVICMLPSIRDKVLQAVQRSAQPYGVCVPTADIEDAVPKDLMVVSMDDVLQWVVDACWEQANLNRVGLSLMYKEFDSDGNGVLSFQEFSVFIGACVPEAVPTAKCLRLFTEVLEIDASASGDEISLDAFLLLCQRHAIAPPPEYLTKAAASGI